MEKEIETRAVVSDKDDIIQALIGLGFAEAYSRPQTDITIDHPDGSLFRSGRKIRIRVEGNHAELTYKGASQGDRSFSRRNELNLNIPLNQVDDFRNLFEAIGFPPLLTITKHRTCLVRSGIKVTFDEWPIIGCVMEIEGPEQPVSRLIAEVVPNLEFKHYRLKELFEMAAEKAGASVQELQKKYERENNVSLGQIDLLLR